MIKVAVVDDHPILRQGIIGIINKNKDMQVIFEAGNGAECIDHLRKQEFPEIILLDIQMPVMNGFETLLYLQQHYEFIKVIMISLIQDSITVKNILEKGAKGFISKNCEPEDIIRTIEEVYHESTVIPEKVVMIPSNDGNEFHVENVPVLTGKELDLLKYVATSFTYDQIAMLMDVSSKSIEHYRTSLFRKFNVQTRQELATVAVKMGLAKESY